MARRLNKSKKNKLHSQSKLKQKNMKKIILTTLTVFALSMFSNNVNAQRAQGEVDITVGVGYSLGMDIIKRALNAALKEADLNKIQGTPIINGMIDYGVTENFSIGGAYSYHQWGWTDRWTTTDSLGAQVTTTGDVKLSRHNIGGRGLFHFGNSDDVDLYAGARLGTSIWKYEANASNTEGEQASDYSAPGGVFTAQALFGVRAYFNEFIGANFEFGIGTAPYMIAGGLCFRLGGN